MGKDRVPYKQYLISDFNQRGKIPIQTNFIIQWAILRYISRKINNHTIHETDNDSFNKLKFSIFSLYHHSEYFGYCWFEHAWFSSHRILLLIVACLQILCSSIDRVFSQKTGMFEAQNYKELRLFLLLNLWPIFNTLSSFM